MSDRDEPSAVYIQTNEANNRVIAFRRGADGALTLLDEYSTGGAGDATPHLTSQGSVELSGDHHWLMVTNAASDEVTTFAVQGDGGLALVAKSLTGAGPKSIAEHDGLLYFLSTVKGAVIGFRMGESGPVAIPGAEHALSTPEADPAQVAFTPDGGALVVTERGTDSIVTFPVRADGTLGPLEVVASSGPTPYGFALALNGTLVVTEAFRAEKGAAAASSYAVRGAHVTPLTASVGNGRSEICWAAVTPDGRYAFTTNFADGAVSRYSIAVDGGLSLDDATAAITVDGRPGLRDLAVTADGRYLYAIDADAGAIFGWAIGSGGSLAPIGSWDGLPLTIAGLTAN